MRDVCTARIWEAHPQTTVRRTINVDTAPVQDGEIGEWVALPEAAVRLGVCVDTVRRRIKQKELPGRQIERPQGFRWEAYVRDSDVPNGHVDSSPGKEDVEQFLAFIRE